MEMLVTWIIVLMINILRFVEVTALTKENQLMPITIYQGAIASQCAVNALIIAYNRFEHKKVQMANFANGMLNWNLKQCAITETREKAL